MNALAPRTACRAALLAPLLAPLLAAVAAAGWPGSVPSVLVWLMISLLFGAPAYAVLALWLWRRLGGLTCWAEMRRLAYRAPLGYAPLLMLSMAVVMALGGFGSRPDGTPQMTIGLALFGLYGLLLGYGYVVLVDLAFHLMRRAGWVRVEQDALT